MLILSRALLGIAGATIAPSTLSLIFSMFKDPGQRSRAIAVWISAFSAGSAIGPLLGGVMLEYFWWGSVFLLALPVMGALLILGPIVLPEFKDENAGRLDLASVVLSLAAVLPTIFGLKQLAQDGFGVLPIATVAVGILAGVVWVRRQLTLDDPMIDVRLFRIPSFASALGVNLLTIFVASGYFLFVAQYLQLVLGLSPLEAGAWSLPSAIAFVVGSNVAPRLVKRFRPPRLIATSLIVAAVGLALLSRVGGADGLAIVVISSVVISLGLAPVFGLTTELVVSAAPPERAGAASGVSETAFELGGALGISILGSVGVAIYRRDVGAALPAGVPADAATIARDTLGGAVAVAGELPGRLGSAVLTVAQDAFVQGMQVVAGISGGLALGVAVYAIRALRNVSAGPGDDTDADVPTPHASTDTNRRPSMTGDALAEPC
jgi:DHA2 family multidrug resistance protein-like MFS transporter